MNQTEAKEYGIAQGQNAAQYCEVNDADKVQASCDCEDVDAICEECLTAAAFESEQNARSFSPFEHFAHDANETGDRADGIWEAYDAGVAQGIKRGVTARLGGAT